ncbi:hypothetical protein CAL29_14170 [Bordetella genomosp. 10]|uniref:Hemagglutinin n=1 Tax=Bordetella genomosp. 10 TaxID=1416804 RepID=A0A261SB64_9BORD|nr:lactonase family protein [Bordetella genomosp. 10]OZI34634.1 hypothetical protein CAL29_14170 [Bordetella genomosp. 10]
MTMPPEPQRRPGERAWVGCRTTRERAARGKGITAFSCTDNVWSPLQVLGGADNPSYLCLASGGEALYAVHGDGGTVSAFAVQPDGSLALLNRQDCRGRNPVHLILSRSGRWLVVANYATGSVVTIGVEEDGRLSGVRDLIELPGEPGPHRRQQQGSHPHQLVIHPSGRWIAVPDKGCDVIHAIALDEASGLLRHLAMTAVAPGSGPRHLAFSKDGRYAWIVLELTSQVLAARVTDDGEFHAFQRLTTVPASETGENTGSGILMDPTGHALFVSNRGHGSVVRFAIDPATGELSSPVWRDAGGRVPRFITFSPDGDVLVANEDTDTIVRLSPCVDIPPIIVARTGSPVCIVFQE